jgi:hypothetical protein
MLVSTDKEAADKAALLLLLLLLLLDWGWLAEAAGEAGKAGDRGNAGEREYDDGVTLPPPLTAARSTAAAMVLNRTGRQLTCMAPDSQAP